jgi:cytochrome c oxidase subunit 2
VGKGWSILFAVMMALCGLMWVVSPFFGWWLPLGVSTHAGDIDTLYHIILGITGFFFILTEAILVAFMWKYAARSPGEHPHTFGHHADETKVYWTSFFKHIARPVSRLLHNQHRVELAWTLVPAAILLYIAFAQVGTWAEAKYKSRMPVVGKRDRTNNPAAAMPVRVAVSARQWEWRMRYPSYTNNWSQWEADPKKAKAWEKGVMRRPHPGELDDLHVPNELHCIKGQPVVAYVSTLDVIHSFNVPQMRVKQDALPGRVIPAWFVPTDANCVKKKAADGSYHWVDGHRFDKDRNAWVADKGHIWEIACAELCGANHYRMVGKVFVHESRADFDEWLRYAEQEQNRHTLDVSEKSDAQ